MNSTCTPPKGCLFFRICCSIKSIASTISARSILTSSTMSSSIVRMSWILFLCILKCFRRDSRFSKRKYSLAIGGVVNDGRKEAKGNWNKEWIVTPLAFRAAMPVGATTTVFL